MASCIGFGSAALFWTESLTQFRAAKGRNRGTSDSGFSKDPCLALWGR